MEYMSVNTLFEMNANEKNESGIRLQMNVFIALLAEANEANQRK